MVSVGRAAPDDGADPALDPLTPTACRTLPQAFRKIDRQRRIPAR
jgi:hypothetical protein